MKHRRHLVGMAVVALIASGCGTTTNPSADAAPTTTRAVEAEVAATDPVETTTTSAGVRELDLEIEPSGWEDLTLTTSDGIDLYARFWAGNDTAVLFTHDFDNPTPGATGQRPEQSSESIITYSSAVAREGFTVLSPDFRGHGQSAGEYDVPGSVEDIAAGYAWLEAEGYETIVLVGFVGSATAAVVLDVERDELTFDGIAMLFSPPQDTGLDASRVLAEIEAPMLFVGSNAGQTASWAKRLEAKATNSYGLVLFDRVPTGLQFGDVFGPELAGWIAEFVGSI